MQRLVGGLVCVLLLGGATVSGAQEPSCRWATDTTTVRDAILFGVTAPEPTNVFAVGARTTSQDRAVTLVRHWDGSAWETQPSPNVNRQSNFLNDVAVAPDGTAWAVGERSRLTAKTIVQRYDGTTWRMQPSLNPSEDLNALHGVDVAPSGDVYAAGARWNSKRRYRTMVHHYDGESWKVFSSRYPGILWDLDVVAEDDVWAVGTKSVDGRGRAFAVHFDGTRWTEVPTPDPGDGFSVLYGVSGSAPDDVWAVGEWYDRGDPKAWVIHFDGTSWSASDIPDLGTFVTLRGVSALDADTAVAVGEDQHDDHDSRVVIEWNGSSWTRAAQDDDTDSNWLQGVDLAPDGGGWAVGYHSTTPSTEYIERRTCG